MTAMTEDEQLSQIRELWQRHGKPALVGASLALVATLGWQLWQGQGQKHAQEASVLYQQLLTAALSRGEIQVPEVVKLGNQLKADYGNTQYAQYASLFLARVAVEAGRLNDAAAELRPLIEKTTDPVIKELSRQRLARIWAAQNEVQRALDLLSGAVDPVFVASREELRGDLWLQQGNPSEARKAYLKAQSAQGAENNAAALQIKLNDLAGDA